LRKALDHTMADASIARRVRARTGPSITTTLLDSDNIDEYPEYVTDLGDKGEYEGTHKIMVAIRVDSERVGLIKVCLCAFALMRVAGVLACASCLANAHMFRARTTNLRIVRCGTQQTGPGCCGTQQTCPRTGYCFPYCMLPSSDTVSSFDHHWLSSAAKSGPVGCND
jgi:hypothetical protein